MAVSIDAAVGGSSSNSYATLAEANTYHDGHPYASTWTAALDDQKNRALVTATRLLDEHVEWDGWVINNTQKLLWPRNGMYYESGYFVETTVIPAKLKDAVAELARQLIAADRTADDKLETQDIKSIKAGSVDLSFGYSRSKVIPDSVFYMIRNWGNLRHRKSASVPLVRT